MTKNENGLLQLKRECKKYPHECYRVPCHVPNKCADKQKLIEALRIADSQGEEVADMDFGEVFWACGVLAEYARTSAARIAELDAIACRAETERG